MAGAAPTIGRGPPDKEPKGRGDGGQIDGFAQKDRYSRASGEDARFAGANGETFPTARELLDMYDAIGIEAGVMLPYINVECAYGTVTNREIAEMAAAHSGRLHWFCNIDPRQGGNAPVDVWNGYPKGRVAAGGRVVELMRCYGNLCGDLSTGSGYNALSRDPEFACDFIEEFQDRLFYGTDFTRLSAVHGPAEKLAAFLDEAVLTGRISRAAYEKVCRGNALRLIQAARRFAAS